MASITPFPVVRHLRGSATTHVTHLVAGRTKHAGTGQSFWFRPLTAVLSEVPVDDRELPITVSGRTEDLQLATVNATIGYRFTEPDTAATRLDFSISPLTGEWTGTPLEQVATVLTDTATSYAVDAIATMTLDVALRAGAAAIRNAMASGLATDPRLAAMGISVLSVRLALVRPTPDLEKALATPAREAVQQEADRATFERRARAVEREAAIGENELANQIELARRTEQLLAQRGANARREALDAAEADAIAANAEAARAERVSAARAEATRLVGQATADAERALVAAYADAPQHVLTGMALRDLAEHLPAIGQLVVTPDLLAGLAARLGVER